jgi:hypothetical protein
MCSLDINRAVTDSIKYDAWHRSVRFFQSSFKPFTQKTSDPLPRPGKSTVGPLEIAPAKSHVPADIKSAPTRRAADFVQPESISRVGNPGGVERSRPGASRDRIQVVDTSSGRNPSSSKEIFVTTDRPPAGKARDSFVKNVQSSPPAQQPNYAGSGIPKSTRQQSLDTSATIVPLPPDVSVDSGSARLPAKRAPEQDARVVGQPVGGPWSFIHSGAFADDHNQRADVPVSQEPAPGPGGNREKSRQGPQPTLSSGDNDLKATDFPRDTIGRGQGELNSARQIQAPSHDINDGSFTNADPVTADANSFSAHSNEPGASPSNIAGDLWLDTLSLQDWLHGYLSQEIERTSRVSSNLAATLSIG